ncbi:hypothetical protein MPLDJ20_210073 [Mesorhizobium plurifarium]|uniref:Uncharacterized protein n=1 Tax=Mesorhizobium plurifarium TaxID=69974 RepID=A0A090F896_MESPL|nr:hypothetical protein MPLDJ20_210073 [Mesorhizobium plurifarium]
MRRSWTGYRPSKWNRSTARALCLSRECARKGTFLIHDSLYRYQPGL